MSQRPRSALERPLSHLIHTHVGGAGYRTVEAPDEWPRRHVEEVDAWLQSLKPESKIGKSYASGCFKLADRLWSAIAVLDARFGTDQHIRQGVLAHALLVPVSEADGSAAHQVALLQAAQSIGQKVEQISGRDSASQLTRYQEICRGMRGVLVKPVELEPLRHVVGDTLPWLLSAVEGSGREAVAIPQNPNSGLSLPQRLAHAASALPPRLGLTATWGCWVRPHKDLRLVVDLMATGLEAPSLPPSMAEYVNWLTARLRHDGADPTALAAVLSNWQIIDWETLGHAAVASGRGSHRSTAGPNRERGAMHKPETRQPAVIPPTDRAVKATVEDSRPRGSAAADRGFTPDADFFQAQLDAMRRELDRGIARRFELLEKSLGVPVGSSRPESFSPSPAGVWLRRAERPLLYALVLTMLGACAWLLLRSPQHATERPVPPAGPATGTAHPAVTGDGTGTGGAIGPDEATGTGDEPAGEEAQAAAGSGRSPQEPGGAGGSSPAYDGGWKRTWTTYASDHKASLAGWLRKIADLEGVEAGQVSQGQRNRIKGFSEQLQTGRALNDYDLGLARKALFEYVVARWARENQLSDPIKIDLDLREIQQDLIKKLLADLAPSPAPARLAADDDELQAAVVCTWIERQAGR